MTIGHLVMEDYIITKRFNQAAHIRYREQGIGFEPIIFDHAGDMSEEEARILDSLDKAIDGPIGRPIRRIRLLLRERISIVFQRYASHCLIYR